MQVVPLSRRRRFFTQYIDRKGISDRLVLYIIQFEIVALFLAYVNHIFFRFRMHLPVMLKKTTWFLSKTGRLMW